MHCPSSSCCSNSGHSMLQHDEAAPISCNNTAHCHINLHHHLKAQASLLSEYVLPDLYVKMSDNKASAGLLQVILAQDTAALVARLVVIKVLKRQFSAAGQKVCIIQTSTTCNQTGSAMWTCIPSACIAIKIVSPVEFFQLTCIFLQGCVAYWQSPYVV